LERNIVSDVTWSKFAESTSINDEFSFDQLLHLYTVDSMLSKGELSLEEAVLLLQTLKQKTPRFEGKIYDLFFIRKMGVSSFILALSPAELIFDDGVRLVAKVSMGDLIEELKGKLT